MRTNRLTIHNIGLVKDTDIVIDKPLIIFFGAIKMGKTTILNAVRWAFGGSFPEDIITHGKEEAFIEIEFDNGSIRREWYKGKDGSTVNRPIVFIRDGKPVKKPVDEIKKFLNPFLLDQDYLRKMTETERKNYFAQLFGVDTAEIDQQYSKCESDAKEVRAKIKGYGEIDLKEVKQIDVVPLKMELVAIRVKHQKKVDQIVIENREIVKFNNKVAEAKADICLWDDQIEALEQQVRELKVKRDELHQWVIDNPNKEEHPLPELTDTSELEGKIAEAAANEVRVEQYQKNLKRAEEKATDEKALSELEAKERSLKREKISKLSKINESCPIKNLSFDEMGNFKYDDSTAGMLSGSEIMKLSEELSNLYPKDLGISLIDRAESLGKSIFTFIDRAEKENKSILATVVGESPAIVPEHVGVWVVANGEVVKP